MALYSVLCKLYSKKTFIMSPQSRTRYLEVAAHVVAWTYIFASPLFFQRGDSINWVRFFNASLFSVAACVIFYLNYFVLIPRYFLQRRYSLFLLINLAMVAGISLGSGSDA